MFGTEGRRNGKDEIQSTGLVYKYIVFRGADIKELHVCEPPPPPPPPDPAIIATPDFGAFPPPFTFPPPTSAPAPSAPIQLPQASLPTPAPAAPAPAAPAPPAPAPAPVQERFPSGGRRYFEGGGGGYGGDRFPPRGEYERRGPPRDREFRSGPVPGAAQPPPLGPTTDYNLEETMKQFDKSKLFEDIKKDEKPTAPAYQKKDFFDTISCDSLEGRERVRESHRRNLETFGRDVRPEGRPRHFGGPGGPFPGGYPPQYGGYGVPRGGYGGPRRGGYRSYPRHRGGMGGPPPAPASATPSAAPAAAPSTAPVAPMPAASSSQ